ncbi:LLM class flavin-dependent oxidoreductase [Leucobacter triazinivorans]|uniref:LLM class flavin-dependent oxidoreductase n=1 Tax=Leucobacter triazinivorans TaxID=1784719 RepID=A0A4P6KES2_9MICO|nr:LLM class flavin-dependent oxidoreductase [Leucobacter triazinivorans]QBE48438.1 LLM class flavin-dependent oxidoreductase [Leucobacter triazinivorans]
MTIERPIQHLGFIHLVPFDRENPRRGLEEGLELFEYAEELGLDSGWVRTRHLQHGLPSPSTFFSALSQRTERIGLGTAVIPAGFENPFRLAEDLGTADVLSGGRVLPGLSVHPPGYGDDAVNDAVYDTGWREEDYGYGRLERLRRLLAGEAVREVPEYSGIGGDFDSARVEPHSPGLSERLWYGGGSLRSAEWAGRAGFNWLVSNISSAENGITDFAEAQRNQIDAFRAQHPSGDAARVSVARVIVPTDGATDAQAAKYRDYAEARAPRTRKVHGKNTIIALDVLGSTEEIVEYITTDVAFRAADDYLFELPFEFELADWKHILHQLATEIGPALGWRRATERGGDGA